MRIGRFLLVATGALVTLVAFGLLAGGAALGWVHVTHRDPAGYYMADPERFETQDAGGGAYALTSPHIDLGTGVRGRSFGPFDEIGTARLSVRGADGSGIFIGIGRHADVDAYLDGVAVDEVVDEPFGPSGPTYRRTAGTAPPARPGTQDFWVASASGPGRQTIRWDIEAGDWVVVVMNADASKGVVAETDIAVKTGVLGPIGLGLVALGLAAAALATALLVAGTRRTGAGAAPGPRVAPVVADAERAYPLRIWGQLDGELSRWRWLVKWFLVIPHLVVLAFAWMAFAVLTIGAGASVLFTGRYPASIFDFNAGVLRWTWRVTFYAFTLATDRYPPFSLDPDPSYPADLAVDYPESLSRPLVLVKWWLLALPHYVVLSVFGGGLTWWTWTMGSEGDGRVLAGTGLIGFLVLVAGIVLAATGRYPRSIFDFVMGMQRWTYRVIVYGALMRDEYPPFRLDPGGPDPGAVLAAPPAAPGPTGELATA